MNEYKQQYDRMELGQWHSENKDKEKKKLIPTGGTHSLRAGVGLTAKRRVSCEFFDLDHL